MKDKVRAFLQDYGNNFRQMRKKAHLTQLNVAKAILCSQAIISHIECGYMLPPEKIENALLALYDSNTDEVKNEN